MLGYTKVPPSVCRRLAALVNKLASEAGDILEKQAMQIERDTALLNQRRHFNISSARRTKCHTEAVEL